MKHFDRYIGPKETECFFLIRNCKKYKKKVYKEGNTITKFTCFNNNKNERHSYCYNINIDQ